MKNVILLVLILLVSFACTTPDIVVSDNLKTGTTAMDVKGRQGWKFNQVIKYGEYLTSKVKRGWTSSYDIPFVLRFQGAKEKLSFLQITPFGKQAEILAVSKFKNFELELLNGFLGVPYKYENTFAGTIIPSDDKENFWEFIIFNPENTIGKNSKCGSIQDKNGNVIMINSVRKLEGKKAFIQLENFGFEFSYKDEPIAAVSTINNGKVWIKDNITPDLKLIVSSVSTSILLRNSMQEQFK